MFEIIINPWKGIFWFLVYERYHCAPLRFFATHCCCAPTGEIPLVGTVRYRIVLCLFFFPIELLHLVATRGVLLLQNHTAKRHLVSTLRWCCRWIGKAKDQILCGSFMGEPLNFKRKFRVITENWVNENLITLEWAVWFVAPEMPRLSG